jgi:hypothetical protein
MKWLSQCGIDLHFPGDYWFWECVHKPVGHWCIFENCQISTYAYILGYLFSWYWVVLVINSLPYVFLKNIFSHSLDCFFIIQRIYIFLFLFFILFSVLLWSYPKTHSPDQSFETLHFFYFTNFEVSGLIVKSLFHLELIFVRGKIYFHLSACRYPVISVPFVKGIVLSLLCICGTFVKNTCECMDILLGFLFHWSVCLFLCQHHDALITLAL